MAVKKPKPVQGDQELVNSINMIEGIRNSQVQGIQSLGTAQNSNIQQIYGTLRGGLEQGAQTTQGIYDRGSKNIESAYGLGGRQSQAAHLGALSQIQGNASRLGMDERALGEVAARLSTQAGLYANRNQQSSRERKATMAQQGAGNTAIARMAIESARQAEALGQQELSRRIMAEVAKANSSAATQKAGATSAAASRAAAAAARAEAEANSAMKQLISEQRAAAREARSEARRAARSGGRGRDPLDQAIKMLRIQQMEAGLDPNDPRNQIRNLNLERLLYEAEERRGDPNAEPESAIWEHVGRFQGGGGRSRALLEQALATGDPGKARAMIDKKAGSLNKNVLFDMLRRLENAR